MAKKKYLTDLTAARARELLIYDADTGVFTWRVNRRGTAKAGTVAGYVDSKGYRRIAVDGVNIWAHRLAWLIVYGEWPAEELDHISGDPSDNRISNLREATHAENGRNRRPQRSGLKGVTYRAKRGKYQSQISVDYKRIFLGLYDTEEEAHEAYKKAAADYHGDFARTK